MTMTRERIDQRAISVSVVSMQFKIAQLRVQFHERQIEDPTQREIEFHFWARFCPMQERGFSVLHWTLSVGCWELSVFCRARQNKYAGRPVSMIPKPIKLLCG